MPTIRHSLIAFIEPGSGVTLELIEASNGCVPILLAVIYENLKFGSRDGVPRGLRVGRSRLRSARVSNYYAVTSISLGEVSRKSCPVSSSEGPMMSCTPLLKGSETCLGLTISRLPFFSGIRQFSIGI